VSLLEDEFELELEAVIPAFIPPKGLYRVKLFGRGGSVLYQAYFPAYSNFRYDAPLYHDGMQVYGFEVIWVEI
jgi:hypothetical protein